ncbi:MFS transporter [Georgenia sp. Z1344]|uniref:MFS transporter n=1 Tax=Georgenia sp. Z1344 TaxID=3416706 RepID=UPI003CF1515F
MVDERAQAADGTTADGTSPTRPAGRVRLWTADLVLAWIVNFLLAFVFYFLVTTMAMYAVDRFAAGETASGLASSIFVIGSTVARLFAGWLGDLLGKRRVLTWSLIAFVVASLAYLLVDSLGLLLAVRAIHGVAFALASTAAMAIAQSVIPAVRRAEGTGYFSLSMTLATAVGPFLGLMLWNGPGATAMFVVASAAAVLAMVVSLFLRTQDEPIPDDERARMRRLDPAQMLHPAVLPIASFMLVMAIAYSGVLTYLNSYAEAANLVAGAGAFFLVYAVVMFLTRFFFMGTLQDRRGDNVVVGIAVVAFAAGLAVLGLATADWMVVVAGALMGLGYGTLMSALQAIAVSKVPMRRVGLAISTHFFMVDLGVGVGPVILAQLLRVTGYAGMYLVLAGVVVVSLGLYHLVHGRTAATGGAHAAPSPAPSPQGERPTSDERVTGRTA